ncbi:DUF4395 domain-containing protein [Paenibacillus sp. y28]|uniref:DUF4395 domain-containing protein n=1 Tax=Paenibacillus sp. y28 TaxID=3129110 RepID=UPI00301606FF
MAVRNNANGGQAVREVPIEYVKTGQVLITAFVLAGIVFQKPLLIVILWLVQALALTFGSKASLFLWIGRLLFGSRVKQGGETQHPELLKFNTAISVMLLCLSVACLLLGWSLAGYVLAAVLGLASLAALLGYCLGCTLYYQFKKQLAGRR